MKTLLTSLLILLSISSYAQKPYKSLQECKNDTLQYVAYNFEQNKNRYIGKTMQFLLDEIDIPLMTKDILVGDTGPWAGNKVRSISLHYFPVLLSYKKLGKVVYTVKILFNPSTYSHTIDEFENGSFINEEGDTIWNNDLYQFLKDYEIKEIYVNKYPMREYE